MDGFGENPYVKKMHGRWQGVIPYFDYVDQTSGGGTGKPKKRWRTMTKVFNIPCYPNSNKGKRAAEQAVAEWFESVRDGRDERTETRLGTVGAYVSMQIEGKALSGAIAPHTVDDYQRCLGYINGSNHNGKHIDGIGGIRLEKVTRAEIQAWVNQMAQHYSVQTTRKALMVLKDVGLKKAVLDRRIPYNPAEGVEVAATPKTKEPNYLDARQRAKVLAFLAEKGVTTKTVAVELGLLAGLRNAEVCGLRWRDVDLAAGTLKVTGTINHKGNSFIDSRDLKTKSTKTAGSYRTVPLAGRLLVDLRKLNADTKGLCMAAGIRFSGALYVVGYIDGRFLLPPLLWRWWNKQAKRLELLGSQGALPTFHDLRHTFATTAVSAGVDIKSVSSILGHANAAMTLNTYASSDPDAKRRAMQRVSETMETETGPEAAEIIDIKGTGTDGR